MTRTAAGAGSEAAWTRTLRGSPTKGARTGATSGQRATLTLGGLSQGGVSLRQPRFCRSALAQAGRASGATRSKRARLRSAGAPV